jgi:membrane peptidoglycan carboxypeptidase
MDAQRDTFQFRLDPYDVWFLEAGMRRVVSPGGTAQLSRLRDWDFIGKTGTAQAPPGKDHGWFVGMGGPPGGEAEIAITMFLERAEHGSTASGYVAEAINFYLDRKYGKDFKVWATPRLRIANNMPVGWDWTTPVIDPPVPDRTTASTDPAADGSVAVRPVATKAAGSF